MISVGSPSGRSKSRRYTSSAFAEYREKLPPRRQGGAQGIVRSRREHPVRAVRQVVRHGSSSPGIRGPSVTPHSGGLSRYDIGGAASRVRFDLEFMMLGLALSSWRLEEFGGPTARLINDVFRCGGTGRHAILRGWWGNP